MLRISLIGGVNIEVDGATVPPPSSERARALLAWLALNPGTHPRSSVAARFWPDVLDASARTSLRGAVMELRKSLGEGGELLEASRSEIGLPAGEQVWVDARAFESLLKEGHREEALELCEGDLVAGIDDDWAIEARDAHRDAVAELLGELGGEAEQREDLEAAVGYSRRQVVIDPLAEAPQRELIRRLAAAGDAAAAIVTYERLRERLQQELGMTPSAQTRELVAGLREQGGETGAAAAAVTVALPPWTQPPLPVAIEPVGDFVGREAELERLRAGLAAISKGGRHVIVLEGDPGVGKTRLAHAFARRAHAQGATVLHSRNYEQASVPFQGVSESLREALGPEAGMLPPELAQIVAPGSAAAIAVKEGDIDRYRLFEGLAEQGERISAGTPIAMVLDDLQWADRPSIALLLSILRSPRPLRMLVVMTVRAGEIEDGDEMMAAVMSLERDGLLERITLSGMEPDTLGELISNWAGSEAPDSVTAAVHEETAGNPFFAVEVLRSLSESGQLFADDGSWVSDRPIERVGVPETVKQVVGRRLGRLPGDSYELLTVAAVIGRRFDLDLLTIVAGSDSNKTTALLDEAAHAGIIGEEPQFGRFAFVHELIRETLLEDLSRTRRVRLHQHIAETIERDSGGSDDALPALAYHYAAAAPSCGIEKAVHYAQAAAERATELFAYEEAVSHFERVAALFDESDLPGDRQAQLLLQLGDAQLRAGAAEPSSDAFRRSAEVAWKADSPELLAQAALGIGTGGWGAVWWTEWGTADPKLISLLREAIAGLESDSPTLPRALARLAIELSITDKREEGLAMSAEALELARRQGDPSTLMFTLGSRRHALMGPDFVDERLALGREMNELAHQVGDLEMQFTATCWLIVDTFEIGDAEGTRARVDECFQLAGTLRQPRYLWFTAMLRAMFAIAEGRWEEAEQLAFDAQALGEGVLRGMDAAIQLGTQVATLRIEQNRLAELVPAVLEMRKQFPDNDGWTATEAFLLAATGEGDCGRAAVERITEQGLVNVPRDFAWHTIMAQLAGVAVAWDDRELAAEIYDLLEPFAANNVVISVAVAYFGPIALYLGRLATTLERFDDAERHLARAAEISAAFGCSAWVTIAEAEQQRLERAQRAPASE